MTKKDGRISVSLLEKIVKDKYSPTSTVTWNGLEITVKESLSFKEMILFVDGVVKGCFASDDGAYMPEVKDFVIKCSILEDYTNLTLPQGIERKYDIIYHSDIADVIMSKINASQYYEMIAAIDKRIDAIVNANVDNFNKQVNSMNDAIDRIEEQMKTSLDGVDLEALSKMLGILDDEGTDSSGIIDIYKESMEKKAPEGGDTDEY